MITNRRSRKSQMSSDVPEIVQLWLLRILVPLGGQREFVDHHGFRSDALAVALGLEKWIDTAPSDFAPRAVRTELRKLHVLAEKRLRNTPSPAFLQRNLSRLTTLVGLSQTDCRILEFAILIHNERLLDDAADLLGDLSSVRVFRTLAVLLDIPEHDIRASLNPKAILGKSGLVSVDRRGVSTLSRKLDLLSENFADDIFSSDADPLSLLRDTVVISSPAQLSITDYKYIAPSLAVLRPYLRRSLEKGRKGVNIFLHGDPGTGKSQLAKALAKELDCELFEVASEDSDGVPVNGERRLRAFRAAQSFFSQRKALILFDEVEDVFDDGDGFLGGKSTAQTRKAWINRLLEENPVATLWLSNSIGGVDPAFIRRFDMVFELPIPPKQHRAQILLDACSDLINTNTMARIAESESLSPAVVTRAASVVRSIRDDLEPQGIASAFELLIGNTLKAQGHKPICESAANRLTEAYDPLFINADSDLSILAAGLIQSKSGRLCLYGPPGTGKTAYGRWLSEQMGVSLIVKRASDLMSAWVGDNEKNIAKAFKVAEKEGSLLMIDEVDSFLQDRRGAQRGWEVTLVNEMLTQMESFSGIFIASTNLIYGLDQAALRRFDLKVKFDFVSPQQATGLMIRYCELLSIPMPETETFTRLMKIKNLTPGDFATVIRQSRFRPITSSAVLVDALEAECALKEQPKASIGFIL